MELIKKQRFFKAAAVLVSSFVLLTGCSSETTGNEER